MSNNQKKTNNSVLKSLVSMADKFDREGKQNLADAVDSILLSTAARPKSTPLKNLDEDVKKDLLKFIHRVKDNVKDSVDALEEFFRRLRYFDSDEHVKDLKLDKILKELEKTHDCMDGASRTMYALTYGKHPSKADLEQQAEDFKTDRAELGKPLEFFESQHKSQDPTPEKDLAGLDENELLGSFVSGPGGTIEEQELPDLGEEKEHLDVSQFGGDEEYEEFMKGLDDESDELESFEDED